MNEFAEAPEQYAKREKIGYLLDSALPVVHCIYYYANKWWNVEWWGMWFVDEYLAKEGETIYTSEAEALATVKKET